MFVKIFQVSTVKEMGKLGKVVEFSAQKLFKFELACAFSAYSNFEKGCWKKCTRQSQNILWVEERNLKELHEGLWTYVCEC